MLYWKIGKEVQPFLDWSLIQPGWISFGGAGRRTPPIAKNMPYGIKLVAQKAVLSEPWLRADRPWEEFAIGLYMTALYEKGKYRLWYEAQGPDFKHDMDCRLCYAESSDGMRWEKPNLSIIKFKGRRDNNIVFDKSLNGGRGYHGGTVFKDPSAPAGEQYKVVHLSHRCRIRGATSPDGIHWKPLEKPVLEPFFSDSQTTAYYDTLLNCYVGYFRWWDGGPLGRLPCGGPGRRGIARATAGAFGKWGRPEPVLCPGIHQHPSHDFYTNGHVLYPGRSDLHLMFPSQYNREKDVVEVHLATSRDGIRWELFGQNAVVPAGCPGSGMEGSAYAGCGIVPLGQDRVAVPCSGQTITHNDTSWYTAGKSRIGTYFWATWKRDRLVAIEAKEGGFVLPALKHRAKSLFLNASTDPAGEIRVEIAERDGAPLKGYSLPESDPINGDHPDKAVTWKGRNDISKTKGKMVDIRFRLRQARLFAFRFGTR